MLQVSSAAHLWLIDHVRCLEHGELIHGSAHRAEGLPRTLTEAEAFLPSRGSRGSHNCEHCSVAAERKDAVALDSPSEVADAPRLAFVTTTPVAIGDARPGPLRFRIAPKNSPPA
ncbi:MAG: hypothetical protein AAF997_00895 [Myxococcota bacterium]